MQKKLLVLILMGVVLSLCTGCLPWLFPGFEPNNAPIITSTPIINAAVGIVYTYNVEANDPDGDTLTYSLTESPNGMTIEATTGIISWFPTAEGNYQVIIEVSDGSLSATQSFTVIVSLEAVTSSRVVMVELFVGPACSRCPEAKGYMAQLLEEYGFDKLVVLEEYPWNYPLSSGWSTSETSKRYMWYTSDWGTPDAYFNGLNQTIHSNEYSYSKYKAAIDKELAKLPKVTISATYKVVDRTVNISGNINNISFETLNNIIIGAMIYEDSVPLIVPDYSIDTIVNHVVRDIITSEEIDSFSPEEEPHSFSLTSDTLNNVKNMNNIHVVVYVQAPGSLTKEILQALYVN